MTIMSIRLKYSESTTVWQSEDCGYPTFNPEKIIAVGTSNLEVNEDGSIKMLEHPECEINMFTDARLTLAQGAISVREFLEKLNSFNKTNQIDDNSESCLLRSPVSVLKRVTLTIDSVEVLEKDIEGGYQSLAEVLEEIDAAAPSLIAAVNQEREQRAREQEQIEREHTLEPDSIFSYARNMLFSSLPKAKTVALVAAAGIGAEVLYRATLRR